MSHVNRRDFIKLMGITAGTMVTPSLLKAGVGTVPARVAVIGAGFAGATAAKYIRLWSKGSIIVDLIDSNAAHVSCVMSNLTLNGKLNMNHITFSPEVLENKYGVNFIQGSVIGVNTTITGKKVLLASGQDLDEYDYVVLAPGISFDPISGLDHSKVPHAWIAGEQTDLLRTQLESMPDGGTVVMTVPKTPYRCPPGPYERACVIADMLKRKGGGTLILLDENPDIVVEKHMFETAFTEIYGDIIQYIPNTVINEVDSNGLVIDTNHGDFSADVMNVIPTHRSGIIIQALGLDNIGGRWAGVNPISYESTAQEGFCIIGDSSGDTGQPKSGHMANSQAKVCADAIIRKIAGLPINSPDRLSKITTNSACYSPITYTTATWLTAAYAYNLEEERMIAVQESLGQAELHSKDHFEDMYKWAENLFADTFM